MEVRLYRNIEHPDMQMEIRLALEDAGLDVRFMPVVTGLMKTYGWQIPRAVACVRAALRSD